MATLQKNAQVLNQLRSMVSANTKEASVQSTVSGVPGKDTKITSVSDSADTTDKNGVGADKLKQEYGQKPSTDSSAPAKTASDIAALGAAIIADLNKVAEGVGQAAVVGEPGKDTKITSVSDKTETTNKDGVGADKNDPQSYKQEAAKTDAPAEQAKTAQELAKVAQDELGRQLAVAVIGSLQQKQEKMNQ